jgi:hypothetical protein
MGKKAKKFELKEGRGSLWRVAKEDRKLKDIRFNGQVKINGVLTWVTLFKNHGSEKAPALNLSIGDPVKSKK